MLSSGDWGSFWTTGSKELLQLLRLSLVRNLVTCSTELGLLVSQNLPVPLQKICRLSATVRCLLHLVVCCSKTLYAQPCG